MHLVDDEARAPARRFGLRFLAGVGFGADGQRDSGRIVSSAGDVGSGDLRSGIAELAWCGPHADSGAIGTTIRTHTKYG